MVQNCMSLNLSTSKRDNIGLFNEKLEAILSSNADVHFLIDIRAAEEKFRIVEDYVECSSRGNFKIIFNSRFSNKRGVAILYRSNLNMIIEDYLRTDDCNVLLVNAKLNGKPVTLGAVYGNKDSEDEFFYTNLINTLSRWARPTFILGGDHNAVISLEKPSIDYIGKNNKRLKFANANPEVLNMPDIPNSKHSAQIVKGILDEFWVDPFRHLNIMKREYSYIPKQFNKANRSRIDFFLTSPNITNIVDTVTYEPSISTFDHKTVVMKMRNKNIIRPPTIDNNFLHIPGIHEIAVDETLHLLSLHSDQINNNTMLQYHQVTKTICDVCVFMNQRLTKDRLLAAHIESLQLQAKNLLSSLPSFEVLFSANFNISPSLLIETQQNNIKLKIVNHQCRFKKAENLLLSNLIKKCNQLKGSEESHCHSIFEIDEKISGILDEKIRRQCKKSRSWRALHLEKASKAFCSLANLKKKSDTLSSIRDTSDPLIHKDFKCQQDRSTYISNFYRSIYSKGPSTDHNIERFLGQEISDCQYVANKKLSEAQKIAFESDISLTELDKCIKSANKDSAPGLDGWSYKALDFLWPVFRVSLKNAFTYMCDNNTLEFSLKNVNVRLIPKKGSTTDIKNWRPISLLSTFYKVPASAYSNRLKEVLDQICSVRQKAYSSKKVIHECVINMIDNIVKSNAFNKRAAIICIDFTKAFDCISHDYVISVLKFFNFGDKMLKMAKTLLSGRTGSIITEDGLSPSFPFLSGTGQGAPESAFFFIIALEILLIKLKLTPLIERISIPCDNTSESLQMVGFADDLNDIIEATSLNLTNYKTILSDFYRLSDLAINTAKTAVVPVAQGRNNDFIQDIITHGFSVEDNFKILGFNLNHNCKNLEENVNRIIDKITNIISFWDKLNLTLAGRIAIYKAYILSNISYTCTVINPKNWQAKIIDDLVFNFVTKNINMRYETAFRNLEMGGVGIIKCCEFIRALRVGIFQRSLHSTDSWATAIKLSRISNTPFRIDTNSPYLRHSPCSKLMAIAFNQFSNDYFRIEGNLKYAPIFENISFFNDSNGNYLKCDAYMRGCRGNVNEYRRSLLDILLCDVYDFANNTLFEKEIIDRKFNVSLCWGEYIHLRVFCRQAVLRAGSKIKKPGTSLREFMFKNVRGSKRFRLIMDKVKFFLEHPPLQTRLRRINAAQYGFDRQANPSRDANFYSVWSKNFIWNYHKEIFIKYLTNRLQFNDQRSHMNNLQYSTCTLCRRNRAHVRRVLEESVYHCVFDCPIFNPCIEYYVHCISLIQENFLKCDILLGASSLDCDTKSLINVYNLLIINFVYKERSSHINPTAASLKLFLIRNTVDYFKISNKFKRLVIKTVNRFNLPADSFLHPLNHVVL